MFALSLCALVSGTALPPRTTVTAPPANVISGRVTMADGTPLRGEITDIAIRINGITMAGANVSYSPVVRPDGTYRQRVAPGQYSFSTSRITVTFGSAQFALQLEPVGSNWNKNQDADDGITQHFTWKVTGATRYAAGQPSPNNHTHWYGMSVGMGFQTYRSDLKRSSVEPPDGTRLVFTATATSRSIDGRVLAPVVIERAWKAAAITHNDDLNDLVPANYDITGVAILPDGTRKPIVFQGAGNYPNYVSTLKAPLETGSVGGINKLLAGWAID
ncbi:MAG: hypothetical protein IT355_13545 [Gemmatimonadaceae bacterium]|nr:hypothetical protein [Gemmatimonadaceae bacterium]